MVKTEEAKEEVGISVDMRINTKGLGRQRSGRRDALLTYQNMSHFSWGGSRFMGTARAELEEWDSAEEVAVLHGSYLVWSLVATNRHRPLS